MGFELFYSEVTGSHYMSKNKKKRAERMFLAKQKGTHTKKEWLNLKSKYKVCPRCNGKSGLVNLEKDHIIPIYMGGSDSIDNIQPICAKCNASKGNETINYKL